MSEEETYTCNNSEMDSTIFESEMKIYIKKKKNR